MKGKGSGFFNDDFGLGGVMPDRFDALQTAALFLVAGGDSDDLAVAGFQVEAVFTALIQVQLKLWIFSGRRLFGGLVFQVRALRVFLDRLHTVLAGGQAGVHLRRRDHLAISGFQMKGIAGFDRLDNKFSHDKNLPGSILK